MASMFQNPFLKIGENESTSDDGRRKHLGKTTTRGRAGKILIDFKWNCYKRRECE